MIASHSNEKGGTIMTRKTHGSILTLICTLTLICSLWMGCASKKPWWGDPETGFILRYRLDTDRDYTYRTNDVENSFMEMMGQSMESETHRTMTYSIKATGYNDVEDVFTDITVDSISWIVHSAQGDRNIDTKALYGKHFGLSFSTIGEELEFTGIDTLPKIDLGMMGGRQGIKMFFRSILPDLPPNPVKIGDSWTSKQDYTEPQSNMDVTIVIESEHTLEAYETVDSIECLRIKTESTATIDGKGDHGGTEITLEGDSETSTTWYFNYKKGTFVKATSESLMEGSVVISGQTNMSIPMSRESKSEVRLVSE
jgi:hypothetical protein